MDTIPSSKIHLVVRQTRHQKKKKVSFLDEPLIRYFEKNNFSSEHSNIPDETSQKTELSRNDGFNRLSKNYFEIARFVKLEEAFNRMNYPIEGHHFFFKYKIILSFFAQFNYKLITFNRSETKQNDFTKYYYCCASDRKTCLKLCMILSENLTESYILYLSSDPHQHRGQDSTKLPDAAIKLTIKLLENNVTEKKKVKQILHQKGLEPTTAKQEKQLENFLCYYKKKLNKS